MIMQYREFHRGLAFGTVYADPLSDGRAIYIYFVLNHSGKDHYELGTLHFLH